MKIFLILATATLFVGSMAAPAQPTRSGQISDSLCRAVHVDDPDVVCGGGEPGPKNPHECTVACVRGGNKYVFASGRDILTFADQKDPALKKYAGAAILLAGAPKGNTIALSKIDVLYQ